MTTKITPITPAEYRRIPWKNGGGISTDIATDAATGGEVWRFGRTPIPVPGPFSDYTGYDRVQVLVAGRGMVLDGPDGEIDLRQPFVVVRYKGELPLVSRLEAGPVEVVNLIGLRAEVKVDLQVLDAGQSLSLPKGLHFAYAPSSAARVADRDLPGDHSLRIDAAGPTMLACGAGRVLVASIVTGII
ncbi:MAG: HutD family protein [Proteobacteria bacterium]|nr:HutD family protein [Pseudomonadota bacterium]